MKQKKLLAYTILPVMAFAIFGVSQASAHGWFGQMANATPEEIAQRQTDMFTQQASLLGISVDAVKQGWAEGKNLPEIATANGISETDLEAKMEATAKQKQAEHLKALVDKGIITQVQADQRLKVDQERMGNGMGKGHGRGLHTGDFGRMFNNK